MFEALRNQRDSHNKESSAPQNTFEEFLVNRDWMEKWQKYVSEELKDEGEMPGPIDNSSLLLRN